MKEKEIPFDIAVLIVRLVYNNLSDEGYIKLEKWMKNGNEKIFLKKIKVVIDEKYNFHWSKKKK